MNKIKHLFQQKQRDILNIYCTAGYPTLDATSQIMMSLEKAGADIIELGMPYSDPLADGPTIQKSSTIALKNGMSMIKLFEQLEGIRSKVQIPIILMGYLNPVMQYGIEAFLKKCHELGIDGLILPDLPMDEYEQLYKKLFQQYNIQLIFLITPNTSEERIRKIDSLTDSFIYVVSSASTTGKNQGFGAENINYFKRIQAMNLKNPYLIGFGIGDAKSYQTACKYANGAIIGSAFIRALNNSKNLNQNIQTFIQTIKVETLHRNV